MPLLEIVRTDRTSKQVVGWAWKRLGVLVGCKAGCRCLQPNCGGARPQQPSNGCGRPASTPARPCLHPALPASFLQVILDTLEFSSRIKKTPVLVGNCTGFAVNRVFFPYTQVGGCVGGFVVGCRRFGAGVDTREAHLQGGAGKGAPTS